MDINDTGLNHRTILDAQNDGIYAVDTDRRIVYWGKSAERMTGWSADEIVGRCCYENILCHIDKDGHRLCGKEYCPLHRAMVTDTSSVNPVIVFAKGKDGSRIPMQVTVAPIRCDDGRVIGGVETFRDLSGEIRDYERVKKIQTLALRATLPEDSRVRIAAHYVPHDIIGGDYYAVAEVDPDRYAFLLADVTGHGVAAALYTMYLRSLWENHHHLLASPGAFSEAVNDSLCDLIKEEGSFAASVCGVVDLEEGVVRLAASGGPQPIMVRQGGDIERLECSGLPLGLFSGGTYPETAVEFRPGDRLLLFTDGADEISIRGGGYLGSEGLIAILADLGYPASGISLERIEEEMLRRSDRITFDDDLTLLEVCRL